MSPPAKSGGQDRITGFVKTVSVVTNISEDCTVLTAVPAGMVTFSRRNIRFESFQLSFGRKRRMVAKCDVILIRLIETGRDRLFKARR
jgi:hypothetical protein